MRAIFFLHDDPEDNHYARPIQNVVAYVDLGARRALIEDHGVVPIPTAPGEYAADRVDALRQDLRPLEITQPEGPSFAVEGHHIRWQKWRLRVSLHPLEGLALHDIRYDDDGNERRILHRAALSDMIVPYGEPGAMHGWKNALDAAEAGLGQLSNSLRLGCDCPRRDPLLRCRQAPPQREDDARPERDLPARRGLRRPVEAHRLLHRRQAAPGGTALAAPGRERLQHARQLRLRLLLVLLPRRHDPARDQADGHGRRVRGGRRGRVGVRAAGRAGHHVPHTPAPVLLPAGFRPRRRAQLRPRGRRGARARQRSALGHRVPVRQPRAAHRAGSAAEHRSGARPFLARGESERQERPGGPPSGTSSCRTRRRRSWRPTTRCTGSAARSRGTTSG